MGYLEVIPSQTRALEYLGRMTRQYPDARLRIGGGELLAIGFSGRAVGRAKQRLLDEVASERLANEHGALVRRAERLYRSGWRGETDGRE